MVSIKLRRFENVILDNSSNSDNDQGRTNLVSFTAKVLLHRIPLVTSAW